MATKWVEGKEMKISKQAQPTKKKIRVGGPYLSPEIHHKADRLSRVLKIGIPMLLEEMANLMLNRPDFVNYIQDKYGIEHSDTLRLRPIVENGKINF